MRIIDNLKRLLIEESGEGDPAVMMATCLAVAIMFIETFLLSLLPTPDPGLDFGTLSVHTRLDDSFWG